MFIRVRVFNRIFTVPNTNQFAIYLNISVRPYDSLFAK